MTQIQTHRSPGRPPGIRLDQPSNPDRVDAVLQWRREQPPVSYAEIGRRLGITRAGARHIWNRWNKIR